MEPPFRATTPLRDWLLCLPEVSSSMARVIVDTHLRDLHFILEYGSHYPSSRKRIPMTDDQMEKLAGLWTETIAALTNAHTKDDYDRADFRSDDLLDPILTAPVAQLRAFTKVVAEKLQADPRVPYWVWEPFRKVATEILPSAPDSEALELKTALAAKITAMVEKDEAFTRDLLGALTGALQWRDEETLTKIKGALESGAKPRARGRQSCLFLEVDLPGEAEPACVML